MNWVTWQNVAVDRMACAWLIRRFLDKEAKFVFVPSGQKPLPHGEPFDIPGARLSHRRGHCTMHTMLREYDLQDPILDRIARIVDEADVVQQVTVEPAAPGLDLVCRGIRLTSPDDQTAIERGELIYEALYAQLAEDMSAGLPPQSPQSVATTLSAAKGSWRTRRGSRRKSQRRA